MARYCAKAGVYTSPPSFSESAALLTVPSVWQDDVGILQRRFQEFGLTFGLVGSLVSSFISYAYWNLGLGVVEWGMDLRARMVKMSLWAHGLATGGLGRASQEMAGLRI